MIVVLSVAVFGLGMVIVVIFAYLYLRKTEHDPPLLTAESPSEPA